MASRGRIMLGKLRQRLRRYLDRIRSGEGAEMTHLVDGAEAAGR
jgi:hypothetical protein